MKVKHQPSKLIEPVKACHLLGSTAEKLVKYNTQRLDNWVYERKVFMSVRLGFSVLKLCLKLKLKLIQVVIKTYILKLLNRLTQIHGSYLFLLKKTRPIFDRF